MKVIKAKYAGACYGVQRAIDMAYGAIQKNEITHSLGPLIHNPMLVEKLESRGVNVANSVEDVSAGTLILRSHGVVPAILKRATEKNLDIVDATCPHVSKAQKAAMHLSENCATVIIVGEQHHPEVQSLEAYVVESGGVSVVVTNPKELPDALNEPVGVVVQTTQPESSLNLILDELESRNITPVVKNTICFATRQRQDAAVVLAGQVDAVVVIGGKNSSNTSKLFKICKEICSKSYHIESSSELDPAWFENCETVGICAGASTPDEQIQALVQALEKI